MNTATPAVPAPESRLAPCEGRDAGGRFSAGNRGGPGNPFAREVENDSDLNSLRGHPRFQALLQKL